MSRGGVKVHTCRGRPAAEEGPEEVADFGVTGLGGGGRKTVGPVSVASAFAIVTHVLAFGGSGAATATGAGAAGKLAAASSCAGALPVSTAGFASAGGSAFAGLAGLCSAVSAGFSAPPAVLALSLVARAGSLPGFAAVASLSVCAEGVGCGAGALSTEGFTEAGCTGVCEAAEEAALGGGLLLAGWATGTGMGAAGAAAGVFRLPPQPAVAGNSDAVFTTGGARCCCLCCCGGSP